MECWLAARLNLAEQLLRSGKVKEATAESNATGKVLRPWLERSQNSPVSAETLVNLSLHHAMLLEKAPDMAEALHWYKKSASFLETPLQPTLGSQLSQAWTGCSRCYKNLGKTNEAAAAAKAAQEAFLKKSPVSK